MDEISPLLVRWCAENINVRSSNVNVRWTVVVRPLSIHWPNIVVPCPISTDTNWKGRVSVPVCSGRSRARRRLSCLPTSRDSEHTMVTSIGFVTNLVHHTVVLQTFSTWGVIDSDLFSPSKTDPACGDRLVGSLDRCLSDGERDLLEGPLTLNECAAV